MEILGLVSLKDIILLLFGGAIGYLVNILVAKWIRSSFVHTKRNYLFSCSRTTCRPAPSSFSAVNIQAVLTVGSKWSVDEVACRRRDGPQRRKTSQARRTSDKDPATANQSEGSGTVASKNWSVGRSSWSWSCVLVYGSKAWANSMFKRRKWGNVLAVMWSNLSKVLLWWVTARE